MTSQTIFNWLLIAWFALAVAIFIALFFINAPYGRYLRRGWGPRIDNRLGWFLMESGAALLFAYIYFTNITQNLVLWIFFFMWEAHYFHRAFLYPFNLKGPTKRIPLAIVAFGLIFNFVNAYLNGQYLIGAVDRYPISWILDLRFIIGTLIFVAGYIINRQSDNILSRLRNSANGYAIPEGGLFCRISCPNYLGEITLWTGWAIATWSLPGLAFAVWTAANLVPRARAIHAWYQSRFPDYPENRRALLPGIW